METGMFVFGIFFATEAILWLLKRGARSFVATEIKTDPDIGYDELCSKAGWLYDSLVYEALLKIRN